ncbi:3'-5' exonuclease domain-containing protein 2 [Deefgea tanakiae]|jgi:ribonuclease D|uniref:3'-5' exonuclease domain-containing protein 2 n=1 Tax=Deefgea tanakiae TaxID=2865840 RepID=A0ABX8Z9L7_9NEIS|nr:3'-5' exonuclease [Deefgea tanakiae]QZA78500.1 3'-5' exonuclease domain-containing protein 2 [Deefgea tanakiae]
MMTIEILPPYCGVAMSDVVLVQTPVDFARALAVLSATDVLGFDTESKPVFHKGQASNGPHLIQLATDQQVFLIPIGRGVQTAELKAILESTTILKVGFGLSDDKQRLQAKLGISTENVLDLARALRTDSRSDMGAKTAVAQFFGQRLQKSKKISTSNWAFSPLSEKQMQYAADDAQVALRVYRAWLRQQAPAIE